MLIDKRLSEDTFMSFAMKIYDNPNCKDVTEFEEDLNRIKYVKRLLNKYVEKDMLRTRLLINHVIIMSNVFGVTGTSRLLFHKLEPNLFPALKTILNHLSLLPKRIPEVEIEKIPLDPKLTKVLGEVE